MISRVAITNFKSIGEPGVDLELKPLTLLVGPNGGGKSSILEAMAVAIQHGITGKLVEFPSFTSFIHKLLAHEGFIEIHFDGSTSEPGPGFRTEFSESAGLHDELLSDGGDPLNTVSRLRSRLNPSATLISSVRGNVPYSVEAKGTPQWVGVHGENLLLLLAMIFGQLQHRRIARRIATWGQRFGISNLHAGFIGGDQSSSDYMDSDLHVALNLALSSSGSKQILAVITQLFWAPEGSLLMIEEPEISLHPQAQIDVLEMFSEAINKEAKQIIATTHSHILLQALGYAVHKGWLKPDDIAVYHIEKKKKGTTAKQLPLGREGYIRGWVPSYSKVEKQLLQEWAKTLPKG